VFPGHISGAHGVALIVQDGATTIWCGSGLLSLEKPLSPRPPLSFKVQRGGVKEDRVEGREEIPAAAEKGFFDLVLDTPGGKGRGVPLVFRFFSQKGHGPVKVMKGKIFRSFDPVILSPLPAAPVGTGNEKTVQHREKDRPLDVETKLPVRKLPPEDLAKPEFLP
jgi:hypothetical protein